MRRFATALRDAGITMQQIAVVVLFVCAVGIMFSALFSGAFALAALFLVIVLAMTARFTR